MPALDYITIRGFKSIRSIEKFPIGAVNVIVGPNGSGKSNFIKAFDFLHVLREGRLRAYVEESGGADRILHFGAKTTSEMEFVVSFEEETNSYQIKLGRGMPDTLFPRSESVGYWDKERYPNGPFSRGLSSHDGEAGISEEGSDRIRYYVQGRLSRWRIFHFHDTGKNSPLRTTNRVRDSRALRPDGSNLAAFLRLLATGRTRPSLHHAYTQIRDTVRQIAPFFDDFILEPSPLNPETIRLEWKHVGTDRFFDASDLSDGTLRFMALATLFLQPPELRPSVILVDEPELGLHPAAITLLAALVRSASTSSQVILSTQSPTLLDHFDPHEVIVADRIGGETKLERLDADRLKEWLEDYSLGQLWEKNEFGGRPAPERAR